MLTLPSPPLDLLPPDPPVLVFGVGVVVGGFGSFLSFLASFSIDS
jgi:hypothetical protein